MKIKTTLLSLALAASAPHAFGQESAELTIGGRIFPGSCVLQLTNGGVADLGDINTAMLSPTAPTDLDPVMLGLTVACESPVRFAFTGADNTGSTNEPGRYGLGFTPAEERIGYAQVNLRDVTVDGGPGHKTVSSDNGQTWSVSGEGAHFDITDTHLRGYAKVAGVSTGPDAIEQLQGDIEVKARIWGTNSLTIDGPVPIAGNVTITLNYL